MRAMVLKFYGGPEAFVLENLPTPIAGDDELLIKIHASSVNPSDVKIRRGDIKIFSGKSYPKISILGYDIAGEVVEVGKNVQGFRTGDAVYALSQGKQGGGYAEYVALPAKQVAHKPHNLDFLQAASVPLGALTAWQALKFSHRTLAGHDILINGACGGVGIYAVQLAKHLGANITAVAHPEHQQLMRDFGADRVLDYSVDDFMHYAGSYDLIFDVAAKRSYAECKSKLKPNGRYLTTVPNNFTMLHIVMTHLRPGKKAAFLIAAAEGSRLAEISQLIEKNILRPIVDQVFPLEQIGAAQTYYETGNTQGRNVIQII